MKKLILLALSCFIGANTFTMRRGAPTTPEKIQMSRRKGRDLLGQMKKSDITLQDLHDLAKNVQVEIDYLNVVARPQFARELEVDLMKVLTPKVYTGVKRAPAKSSAPLMIEDLRLMIEGPGSQPTPGVPALPAPGPHPAPKPGPAPQPAPVVYKNGIEAFWKVEKRKGPVPVQGFIDPSREMSQNQIETLNAQNRELARNILGVNANASKRDITLAYRKLMSRWHPDKMAQRPIPGTTEPLVREASQFVSNAFKILTQ